MVSFFKALTSAFTCKNLSIINQGTKCGVVSSPEIGRLVFQDLHAVYWADPGTYSPLSCPAPGLSAARGWVFWPGQCGNSLPPPLALSLTNVDICTVLYYTVLYVTILAGKIRHCEIRKLKYCTLFVDVLYSFGSLHFTTHNNKNFTASIMSNVHLWI